MSETMKKFLCIVNKLIAHKILRREVTRLLEWAMMPLAAAKTPWHWVRRDHEILYDVSIYFTQFNLERRLKP